MAQNITTIHNEMANLNILTSDDRQFEISDAMQEFNDHLSSDDELDEFLTLKAKMRITCLENSKKNLENMLAKYKKDSLIMKKKLDMAEKKEKELNKEYEISRREVFRKESLLKKKNSEYQNCIEELSQKSQLCRDLNKEIQNYQKDIKEEKKKLSTLESQNNVLKIQIKKLNSNIQNDRLCYQKNQTELQANGISLNEANKTLKRHVCDLTLVVKEQQKLIDVLQQQKAAILGAQVAISMEKEFKEIVQSFCNNSKK